MDEKGSKQVDILDIQPAAAAREQIAATVFEWQSGLMANSIRPLLGTRSDGAARQNESSGREQ
jgi:hypothetical protein